MLHWLVKKHKLEKEKKENIHVSYWFFNNRLFKELSDEVLEVEIIYLYFSFFKKAKYLLWLEPSDEPGARLMHMGILEQSESNNEKVPVTLIVDEYQMVNAVIELKKKVGLI